MPQYYIYFCGSDTQIYALKKKNSQNQVLMIVLFEEGDIGASLMSNFWFASAEEKLQVCVSGLCQDYPFRLQKCVKWHKIDLWTNREYSLAAWRYKRLLSVGKISGTMGWNLRAFEELGIPLKKLWSFLFNTWGGGTENTLLVYMVVTLVGAGWQRWLLGQVSHQRCLWVLF